MPLVKASAKNIAAEKKTLKVYDHDGTLISMEEMLNKSKEGGGAKRK